MLIIIFVIIIMHLPTVYKLRFFQYTLKVCFSRVWRQKMTDTYFYSWIACTEKPIEFIICSRILHEFQRSEWFFFLYLDWIFLCIRPNCLKCGDQATKYVDKNLITNEVTKFSSSRQHNCLCVCAHARKLLTDRVIFSVDRSDARYLRISGYP